MNEAGYRGGATTDPPESPGQQGESMGGIGGFLYDPNLGGGFAYAMDGRLTLGSGGGSAGTDNVRTDNPPGGAGGRGGG